MTDHRLFLPDEESTVTFGQNLAKATYSEAAFAESVNEGVGVESMGGVIHLNGDLGAGKTTLTRGIMRGYGYNGAVKSPTYTLVEPYEFEKCQIYHFDLYRLTDPEEVEYLGTEDYFQPTNLCIVEWANRGAGIIPDSDLTIEFEMEGTGRQISWQIHSGKGHKIAKRLWK